MRLVKIRMLGREMLAGVWRRMWRNASLCVSGTRRYVCFSLAGRRDAGVVVDFDAGSVEISVTNIGSLSSGRGSSFKARTSSVTVAVKSRVCLFAVSGSAPKQVSTSGSILPGPLCNSLSASSSTTNFARFSPAIVSSPDVNT